VAAFAAEDPPVRRGAEGIDVLAQDRNKAAAPLRGAGPGVRAGSALTRPAWRTPGHTYPPR
jgi:hypothetical protein